MNKLQLCQRLRQEAGVSGTGPTTTVGQTGMLGKLVAWIESAYEDIQSRHPNWEFLRNDFSFDTIASTATYTPTAAGLTELANWKKDSFRISYQTLDDEQWMDCYPWPLLRDSRIFGANRTVEGRPTEFAVKPDKSVIIWPTPDLVYAVNGEYYKRAQSMAENTGEPLFPDRFHMAVVWRALMMFAADQEAPSLYTHGKREFDRLFFGLEVDQLPAIDEHEALV